MCTWALQRKQNRHRNVTGNGRVVAHINFPSCSLPISESEILSFLLTVNIFVNRNHTLTFRIWHRLTDRKVALFLSKLTVEWEISIYRHSMDLVVKPVRKATTLQDAYQYTTLVTPLPIEAMISTGKCNDEICTHFHELHSVMLPIRRICVERCTVIRVFQATVRRIR